MKIILAPGDSITAVMSGAATTTNPVAHVVSDKLESTSLSGTTSVTLIENESDASTRVAETVSVVNIDSAAVTVTLSRVAGGTSYKLVNGVTLQAGDVLIYGSDGYSVVDSSGKLKTSSSTTAVEGFSILPTQWRVHDAFASNLPATALQIDNNAAGAIEDANAAGDLNFSSFIVTKKTGAVTTIDYRYATTDAPSSGVILWTAEWEPISQNGNLVAA